jgi:hypothetical protein
MGPVAQTPLAAVGPLTPLLAALSRPLIGMSGHPGGDWELQFGSTVVPKLAVRRQSLTRAAGQAPVSCRVSGRPVLLQRADVVDVGELLAGPP